MPETKTYKFPVCLICEQEIDESNEHRHEGPTHDVQDVRLVPLQAIRERLEAEAEKLERPNKLGEDFTAATVRNVKAQGIRDALASFPEGDGR